MSTQTTNCNLIKPSQDDDYNIDIHNSNMDKIDEKIYSIDSSLGAIQDYLFGVKSDINLSYGDVILQKIDFCKGLLVIGTAYDTNSLILPTTDNYRYSIYNSDSDKVAIVKKAGGNPIEIAPNTMVMVGYDGTDYRMLGGGASDATRFKPSSIDQAVGDLNVVGWDKQAGMWKAIQNGYALYYDGHLYGNGSRVPVTGFEADDGLVAFVNEDGTLTSDGTKVRAGYFVEDGNSLLLDLKGDLGVAKEYTANMQTAFAVIGKSQTCRIKSEMPADADGYYLCLKETEWVEGDDETTGTLVGNFTENYIGDNVWYTIDGLQNNNTYYLKWFPYKGDVVNRTIGVNENNIRIQNGFAFWDFDHISGSIVKDTFNSYNLTNTSCVYAPFKIGDGVNFNSSAKLVAGSKFLPTIFSYVAWLEITSTSTYKTLIDESCVQSGYGYGWSLAIDSSGDVCMSTNSSTICTSAPKYALDTNLVLNTKYMLTVVINLSAKNFKVYIGDTLVGTKSIGSYSGHASILTKIGHGDVLPAISGTRYIWQYSSGMRLDQVMIINGEILQENITKLYNGGTGC